MTPEALTPELFAAAWFARRAGTPCPLDAAEVAALRVGIGAAAHHAELFDALFRFYLANPVPDEDDPPPAGWARRLVADGLGGLTADEVVRVAARPLWLATLRDEVLLASPTGRTDDGLFWAFAQAEVERAWAAGARPQSVEDGCRRVFVRVFGAAGDPPPAFAAAVRTAVASRMPRTPFAAFTDEACRAEVARALAVRGVGPIDPRALADNVRARFGALALPSSLVAEREVLLRIAEAVRSELATADGPPPPETVVLQETVPDALPSADPVWGELATACRAEAAGHLRGHGDLFAVAALHWYAGRSVSEVAALVGEPADRVRRLLTVAEATVAAVLPDLLAAGASRRRAAPPAPVPLLERIPVGE